MRTYPDRPIIGVGAVILDGTSVLLVKRAHEPLKGEWSLPGGAVEVGETLEAAVAREVREETSLEVEVGPLVEAVNRIVRDAAGRVEYHFVIVDFLCHARSGRACPASDADDARWVEREDLMAYGVSDAVIRVVQKAAEIG